MEIRPPYGPGPPEGYIGAPRPMAPCKTLGPSLTLKLSPKVQKQ